MPSTGSRELNRNGWSPRWKTATRISEYRGDGGHVPDTEPSANAYIHFSNGVRGNYIGEKKTQRGLQLQVMATDGRLHIDNSGSARIERDGEFEAVDVPTWDVEGIEAGVCELVDVLNGKGELSCTVRDGRIVVDMMTGMSFVECGGARQGSSSGRGTFAHQLSGSDPRQSTPLVDGASLQRTQAAACKEGRLSLNYS